VPLPLPGRRLPEGTAVDERYEHGFVGLRRSGRGGLSGSLGGGGGRDGKGRGLLLDAPGSCWTGS
jgi:hypothetical protein